MNADLCGKESDCSGLQGDLEEGDWRELVGTTLSMDVLEDKQRHEIVANKERSYSKCKKKHMRKNNRPYC